MRMRANVSWILGLALYLAAGAVFAQVAGRIVLAVGEVTAVRGADRVKLAAGVAVNVGDTIITGPQGHAQLRFSDEGLVALKPDSEFRIEAYDYSGKPDGSERAVFRLIRGGFRTLTGAIGRDKQDAYQVQTTQATIGIRGTHYAVQICGRERDQCREDPNAEPAPAGLFGGVFEGLVAVDNPQGSGIFGARESFFVADGGRPERWLVPPKFLADDTQAGGAQTQTTSLELTFSKVPDYPPALTLAPYPPFIFLATEDLDQPQFTVPQPPIPPKPPPSEHTVVIGSDRYTLELASTPGAQLTLNGAGGMTAFSNASLQASLGSAQLVDTGSDASGGAQLYWGRWNGPGSTITQVESEGTVVHNDGGNLHYIYGNVATALPTSGQFSYSPVGGTRPTDSTNGAAGTLVSGGAINVDFGQARLALTGLQVGFTNANYAMSGSTSFSNGMFSTSPIGASASCAGAGCKPIVAGNFAGFFAGPGGAGIGLDYFFNIPGGVIEGVSGYRKCPGAAAC